MNLSLSSCNSIIAQTLVDGHILFLGASIDNITKAIQVWESYVIPIPIVMYTIYKYTQFVSHFKYGKRFGVLGSLGKIAQRNMICRCLAYPIGNNV